MLRYLYIIFLFLLSLNALAQREEARALLSEARSLMQQADYQGAAERYQRALKMDGVAEPSLFNGNNELARCLTLMGDYQEAERTYATAKQYIGDEDDYDAWLLNSASLLTVCGRYNEADSLLNLVMLPENYGLRDLSLSSIAYRKGENERAETILSAIIEGKERTSLYYTALQNRGFLRSLSPASMALAEQDMKESLAFYTDGEKHFITLSNLAMVEARSGKYDLALQHIDEALAWSQQRPVTKGRYPDHIIMLRKRAEILLMARQRQKAAEAFGVYVAKEREYVAKAFHSMTEQNRLDFWKKESPLLAEAFSLGQDAPLLLLDVALFRREIALLGNADEALMQRRLGVSGGEIRKKLKAGEYIIDFVRYQPLSQKALPEEPVYAAIVAPSALSKEPVSVVPLWTEAELDGYLLPSGASLLEAVCSEARSDKTEIYTDSLLAEHIWQPLKGVLQKASNVYFAPEGLLQLLAIENLNMPILRGGKVKLHRMTSTARLAERQTSPQGTKNQASSPLNGARLVVGGLDFNTIPEAVAQGSPSHDALQCLLDEFPAGVIFNNLDGSKKEVAALDSILKKPTMVSILPEEGVRNALRGVSLLHFSSHAYSLHVDVPVVPEALKDSITEDRSLWSSAMVLSGANVVGARMDREDGLLSARELCDLDLSSVRLAVISACQSAQGTISDEGPTGILRGLKKAGVKSVMATLWPIDDKVTALFMTAFYGNLATSGNTSAALMAARSFIRDFSIKKMGTKFDPSTKRRVPDESATELVFPYKDPYFWAPFVLVD